MQKYPLPCGLLILSRISFFCIWKSNSEVNFFLSHKIYLLNRFYKIHFYNSIYRVMQNIYVISIIYYTAVYYFSKIVQSKYRFQSDLLLPQRPKPNSCFLYYIQHHITYTAVYTITLIIYFSFFPIQQYPPLSHASVYACWVGFTYT